MKHQRLMDMVKSAARPAFELKLHKKSPALSKLGGLPEVPMAFEWPYGENEPMMFLAQIHLAEVPDNHNLEGLPEKGMLYFFYDVLSHNWGFDPDDHESWRVIYHPDGNSLQPMPYPDATEIPPFEERKIEFSAVTSYPGAERFVDEELDDDEADALFEALEEQGLMDDYRHQLGGYAAPVQNPEMELECQLVSQGISTGSPEAFDSEEAEEAAEKCDDWLLLLQLNSDDETGMGWGDSGLIYFFIRKQDLAKGRFDKTWLLLQCS